MLLGLNLDFLLKIGAIINLKELHLLATGATEKVPLEIKYTNTASHTISKVSAEVVEPISSIKNLHVPNTSDQRSLSKEHYLERLLVACPLLVQKQDAGCQNKQKLMAQPTHITLQMGELVLQTTTYTNQLETETKPKVWPSRFIYSVPHRK